MVRRPARYNVGGEHGENGRDFGRRARAVMFYFRNATRSFFNGPPPIARVRSARNTDVYTRIRSYQNRDSYICGTRGRPTIVRGPGVCAVVCNKEEDNAFRAAPPPGGPLNDAATTWRVRFARGDRQISQNPMPLRSCYVVAAVVVVVVFGGGFLPYRRPPYG